MKKRKSPATAPLEPALPPPPAPEAVESAPAAEAPVEATSESAASVTGAAAEEGPSSTAGVGGWEGPTQVDPLALDAADVEILQTVELEDSVPGQDDAPVDEAAETAEMTAEGDASADSAAEEAIGEGGPEAFGDEAALPADASRLESVLESLLFATDRALGVSDLKRLLGERDGKRVTQALEALRDRRADSGIQLVSVAGGWQLRTHPANGEWVAKLVAGRPQRLSRAMMETLAIVAYRQPITRPEIDEIRGVDCGPVLRTLLDRGLIRVIGKKEEVGRPILYGTTPEFLKTFSLRDLTDLPTLREFHELGAAERAEVDAKLPGPGEAAAVGADENGAATGGASGGPGAAAHAGALRPTTVELPNVDPDEEEALLEELEQATQAAGRATASALEPKPPEAGEGDAPGAVDAAGPSHLGEG